MRSATRTRSLAGVALLVAACSSGSTGLFPVEKGKDRGDEDAQPSQDSGPGEESQVMEASGVVEDAGTLDAAASPDAGGDADASEGGSTAEAGPPDAGILDSGAGEAAGDDAGGSDADDSGAVDSGVDAPWIIDVPTDVPQVQDNGGPVIQAPVFQSISFPGYDQVTAIDDFVATVGTTAYWHDAVAEYGIGAATTQPPVHLTEAAPTSLDDTDIQAWLAQTLAVSAQLMTPGANALYVMSYPSTTTITFDGLTSCTGFGGYHNSTIVGGVPIAYAVIPECPDPSTTQLQASTYVLSHELAEATTDPIPISATTTFQGTGPSYAYWEILSGGNGEIGDMCQLFSSSFYQPPGYAYTVQRIWSNASVKKGLDPCQPETQGEVYFNGLPLFTDAVSILFEGREFATGGVQIAVGASRTIPVQLYSEGPMAAWTVRAGDLSSSGTNLAFAWDSTTGKNGDTLHLTITVNATDDTYGGNAFFIDSESGLVAHTWLGYVGR